MSDLFDYIAWRGDLSQAAVAFNDVDALRCSSAQILHERIFSAACAADDLSADASDIPDVYAVFDKLIYKRPGAAARYPETNVPRQETYDSYHVSICLQIPRFLSRLL